MPAHYDLNLYRGDTSRTSFVLWLDAAKTLPFDLTGVGVKAQIREKPDSPAIIAELTCAVTLPNTIVVSVPTDVAATLKSRGAWDLQLTLVNGDIQTVLAGAANATPDVTRPGA